MAPRAANVPYDPTMPAPSGAVADNGSGATYQTERATPESFGAPLARGNEAIGSEVEKNAQKLTGMVMETAANQAELDSVKATAPIIAKYKSLEGLAAYAAAPQFEKEILDTNQKIRNGLPLGAQRMFDSTTARQSAYMIRDYQTYAAGQVKKSTLDSNNAVAQNAVNNAGNPDIAGDDERFGYQVGTIKHSVASMMDLQGYGAYVNTDPETGKINFQDSPEGQQAKSVYQSELDKRMSMAWENRIHVVADQNVSKAYKLLQDNKDNIPGEAFVKLNNFLTPRIRDVQARDTADTILADHNQQYQKMFTTGGKEEIDIADAIHQQESSGRPHDYQIQPGTFKQYAKSGENFDNPEDQDKVYKRIIDDLKTAYPGDPARQAVAYFSGKGNVAPSWSATPWKEDREDSGGKKVSSYVGDILRRIGGTQQAPIQTTSVTPSIADYYRSNYDKIVTEARGKAQQDHPDDPVYADSIASKVEQRMNTAIRGQEIAYKADSDTVVRAVNGDFTKGTKIGSIEQLRAINPQVAQAWDRLTVNNPQAASAIEHRILTSNTRGDYNSSNPVGYSNAEKRILLPSSDPQAITSESQLWPLVANGTITGSDRDHLAKMIDSIQDPKSKSEATLKTNVINSALDQIMPTKIRNSGFSDPEINTRLLNARIAIENADAEAIKAGRTASERYNPESKYFVGNAAKPFLLTPAQKLEQGQKVLNLPVADDADTVKDLTARLSNKQAKLSDLQEAVRDRKITKATAIRLASENKLIKVAQNTPTESEAEQQ